MAEPAKKRESDREIYAELEKQLVARRERILSAIVQDRAQADEQVLASPGDLGDQSVADTSADFLLSLSERRRKEVREIEDALDRMRQGSYGICQSCESPIGPERMLSQPSARLCLDCQSAQERIARVRNPKPFPKS